MSKKVLIIEDDQFLRKIYRNKLTAAGFEVSESSQGEEGWHKAVSEKPDLVILDLMLPFMNGFEVLAKIRSSESKDIPVIILTILGQESDIEKGMKLGATDYLVKGRTDLSQLVKVVNGILTKKES